MIMLAGGYLWLIYKEKKLRAAGEHFTEIDGGAAEDDTKDLPNWIFGVIPLVAVVVTLNILKWPAIGAIGLGIILIALFTVKQWNKFMEAVSQGASGSVMAIMNTAAAVGFGSIVKVVPGFATLTDACWEWEEALWYPRPLPSLPWPELQAPPQEA